MKTLLLLLICFFSLNPFYAQKPNPNYDADLAKELRADDYGMKYYVFVILKQQKRHLMMQN